MRAAGIAALSDHIKVPFEIVDTLDRAVPQAAADAANDKSEAVVLLREGRGSGFPRVVIGLGPEPGRHQHDVVAEEQQAASGQAAHAYEEVSLRPELDQRDTQRAQGIYDRVIAEVTEELVLLPEMIADVRRCRHGVLDNYDYIFEYE